MYKKRVAIITDCPSPYRVDHYIFLQKKYEGLEFHIIFQMDKPKSELRQWKCNIGDLQNITYLKHFTMIMKGRYDDKQVILTYGVLKALNRIGPDVVVCMEYNPTSLQALLWCKLHKIPYISLTDGTAHSERNIGRIQRLARKIIMSNAFSFIASSTKAKEKIESYKVDRPIYVSLLTENIDQYTYKKTHSHNRELIFVGSLIERKGLDLLFAALKNVPAHWHLTVVGSGPLKEEYERQAVKLQIFDRVTFAGYLQQEEIRELYKKSDAFILPTREDCYGLVILEAMCASLPVVCSKYADGAYDLIEDGKTGRIVDPYDSVEFANGILEILNNNGDENEIGINGYNRAIKMSFDNVSINFIEAINNAL